ncbi:MAG: hypothetical protein HQM16_17000 [Deltaproteobacteria bacterium]|nr:hypothetical protein [Deltaproteobacteria bacterium]
MKPIVVYASLVLCLAAFAAYAKTGAVCSLYTTHDCLNLSKTRSEQALSTRDLKEKRRLAKEGLFYAGQCLKENTKSVPCLYYRAVNRGIDLETRTIGVKKGLKEMISDFKTVIELDDSIDNGGAYLALGHVYMEAPALPIMGNEIRKNMGLAEAYALKALSVAPKDAANLKLAGMIAFKKRDYKKSLVYFKTALKHHRSKKSPGVLDEGLTDELKNWIKKAKRKLRE